eukprot:654730-Alexandrium_andersonii.AAC.1
MPSPAEDAEPWFELMTRYPSQWKSLVSGASKSYDAQAKRQHVVLASVKPGRGDAHVEHDQPIQHMCYDCGR